MSAYWKIPLQALVLLVGVLVFLFYLFQPAPLLFNPAHEARVRAAEPATFAALEALGPAYQWKTEVYADGRLIGRIPEI